MNAANLLYSDTEIELQASVRGLLAERCSAKAVLTAYDSTPEDFSKLWGAIAVDLGLSALIIPEKFGGAGATARECAAVMEELGRAVAPVPFLSSTILGTAALLSVEYEPMLRALALGTSTTALGIPLSATPGTFLPSVKVTESGLVGTVTSVAGTEYADCVVLPVSGPDGMELHLVATSAAGLSQQPRLSLDMTRPIADIDLANVNSTRIDHGDADRAVEHALLWGASMLSSEQLGVAQWCLDTTVRYVKERKQFGRAIGSYQAIKHRLADLWLEVSYANAAARYAADTLARADSDQDLAASVAQSYCGEVAVHAAEECIQLHGGNGMTWEYPAHLYLKRAKSAQLSLGSGYRHRSRVGELIDLPAC